MHMLDETICSEKERDPWWSYSVQLACTCVCACVCASVPHPTHSWCVKQSTKMQSSLLFTLRWLNLARPLLQVALWLQDWCQELFGERTRERERWLQCSSVVYACSEPGACRTKAFQHYSPSLRAKSTLGTASKRNCGT